jgi:hypothetical protein
MGGSPPVDRRSPPIALRPVRRDAPSMPRDLEALETTFDLVAPQGDEPMDRFYARLFAAHEQR